jgi:hypothetical protein
VDSTGDASSADAVEFDSTNIGVTWQVHGDNNAFEHVEYATSGDGGRTFGEPVTVPTPYTYNSFPQIDYVGGLLHLFFEGRNSIADPGVVATTTSDDHGQTWSKIRELGPIQGFAPVQEVSIGNTITVAWCCNTATPTPKAVVVQSTDAGQQYSSPFELGPASEEPRLAVEDATHTWATIETQDITPNTVNIQAFRWETGSDPAVVHEIKTYPFHTFLQVGDAPSGGGAPPVFIYYQTLYTPSTTILERLDAADGNAWHNPQTLPMGYTVGDPQIGVSGSWVVFSWSPKSASPQIQNIVSHDFGATFSDPKAVSPQGVDAVSPALYVGEDRIINLYRSHSDSPTDANVGVSASNDAGTTYHTIDLTTADNPGAVQLFSLEQTDADEQGLATGSTVRGPPFLFAWTPQAGDVLHHSMAVAPAAITGDATCDETVNGADLLATLSEAAGLDPAPCLAGADANCNHTAEAADALRIAAFLASLPQTAPANCMPIDV